MKKFLVCLLALVMSISVFAACSSNNPDKEEVSGLTNAKNYLYTMYKDAAEVTNADFTRVGVVKINGVNYTVTWTADSDTVKIVVGDDNMVTIDIDEKNPEEVTYTLTATLTDETGATESVSFTHRVPAAIIIDEGMSYEEIVNAAYALAVDTAMEGTFRLFGTIVKIDTPWSADYQNITVTIQVGDMADKLIMCYRLKGEGADKLAVGDQITVEGTFKNYKGTIEFDAGCVLVGMGEVKDQSAILDAAYSLEQGIAMTDPCTLTGVISQINTAWSEDYQNITVTIICGGDKDRPIMCYRLKGEGAKELGIGDTITVTGIIKNYNGTIEFDAGCTLDAVTKGNPDADPHANLDMTDAAAVVKAAYALEAGASISKTATLTGVITKIDTPYDEAYGNITVTIVVNGMDDMPIVVFRLKGEGANTLAVGDTITVSGTLMNYGGTVEFGSGCTLNAIQKGEGGTTQEPTDEPKDEPKDEPTDEPKDEPTQDPFANLNMSDAAAVVNAAYTLKDGESITKTATLTGVITKIDTPYSEQYKNITVTIVVGDMTDKPIVVFRVKGTGAETLAVGDTITVTGTLMNYGGTVEFGSGCTLDAVTKGATEEPKDEPKDEPSNNDTTGMEAIVNAAYALEQGASMSEPATLVGVITAINTPYSEQYGNITVTMQVGDMTDKLIMCYRLSGTGADTLGIGDTITVTGTLTNYNGKIQFAQGCTVSEIVKGEGDTSGLDMTDVGAVLRAAYALEPGTSLASPATLTGMITEIVTEYSDQYKNITVKITIKGYEDMPIVCYRLKGDGAEWLVVGNTITVTGILMNYSGTIEFTSGCVLDAVN